LYKLISKMHACVLTEENSAYYYIYPRIKVLLFQED